MWASLCLLVPAAIVYMFRNEMYIKYANGVAADIIEKLKKQQVETPQQGVVEKEADFVVPAAIVYMFRNGMYIKYANGVAADIIEKLKKQQVETPQQGVVEKEADFVV